MSSSSSPQKIVLATGNPGKVRELQQMVAAEPRISEWQIVPQSEFDVSNVPETGTTFVENAIIKARHAAAETGLPAIADDSGLVVDVLGGAPGVRSARYAGLDGDEDRAKADKANNELLIAELKTVPEAERTARFVCVLALLRHADDPLPVICIGEWEGRIGLQASGQNGFGYDPLFVVPEHHCMSADLSPEQKNALSHRGQAMRQLVQAMAVFE